MLKNVPQEINVSGNEFNVLNDVIDTLRFRGSIFFHSNLSAPWGMSLPLVSSPRFHVALEGGFHIGAGGRQVQVKPMDIVMIPNGEMHWIADQVGSELVASESAGVACDLGKPFFQQGDTTHRIMCGIVEYDEVITHPIISALPPVFHLSDIESDDNIWMTVKLIDAEIVRTNSKRNIIIDRLSEVLFIQLLTRHVNENDHLVGFFSALREPRFKKVLQLIHQNPQTQWSLDIIGDTVGMSRATLLRKFKAELGVSPMMYVNNWRMAKAHQLLKYSSLSLDDIADVIGFSGSRTFRSAFQRHFGFTPSVLRKSKLECQSS